MVDFCARENVLCKLIFYKMFVLAEMKDVIRVTPEHFHQSLTESITTLLNRKLANKVNRNYNLKLKTMNKYIHKLGKLMSNCCYKHYICKLPCISANNFSGGAKCRFMYSLIRYNTHRSFLHFSWWRFVTHRSKI